MRPRHENSEEGSPAAPARFGRAGAARAAALVDPVQFIVFRVGEGSYALRLDVVREVQAWSGSTPMAGAPYHIRGIVNLRGVVVPIVDMRARLELGNTEASDEHALVFLRIGAAQYGVLVDAISEIVTVSQADVLPVPPAGRQEGDGLLTGLIRRDDVVHCVLDARGIVGLP